jgi:hypothetical protein
MTKQVRNGIAEAKTIVITCEATENERLQERIKFLLDLINGRDRFLVEKGLWREFMKRLDD